MSLGDEEGHKSGQEPRDMTGLQRWGTSLIHSDSTRKHRHLLTHTHTVAGTARALVQVDELEEPSQEPDQQKQPKQEQGCRWQRMRSHSSGTKRTTTTPHTLTFTH